MSDLKEWCSAGVHEPGVWVRTRKCTRIAKVERDGKWYCGQHDPIAKEAQWEAKKKGWDHDAKIRRAEQGVDAALHAAGEAVEEYPGDGLPDTLYTARQAIREARAALAALSQPEPS